MRIVKYTITIKGVETTMLFTPRLFEFTTATMDFSYTQSAGKVAAMYADLAYCAALNYWTLEDNLAEDFKLKRVDFHEWCAANPKEFGKIMRIALEAITNKSLEEIVAEQEKDNNVQNNDKDVKKKTSLSIIQRLKHFLSAIVG